MGSFVSQHPIDERRVAALLDRLDPLPGALCEVSGCVHRDTHHEPSPLTHALIAVG